MELGFNIRSIAIDEIGTDFYQRRLYPERVDYISDTFDVRLVDLPKVCWRNDKWECWDGQHTIRVAKRKGYTHIQCMITEVESGEEAAKLFSIKNNRKFSKSTTPEEDFNARRHAKDEVVLGLDAIIERRGYQFGKSTSPTDIGSRKVPERIYIKYGGELTDTVFDITSIVFPKEKEATKAVFLEGLAYYLHKNKKSISIESFKRKLQRYAAGDIIKEAESSSMFKGRKAFENIFRGIYGKSEAA